MIKAEFNPDTGILIATFEGVIRIKEIIDYMDATRQNLSYPRKLKILTDASDADYNFSPQDLHAVVEANNRSLEQYEYIIDAIIAANSKTTAITMLYQEFSRTQKYHFRVFSTREAALKWLINSAF